MTKTTETNSGEEHEQRKERRGIKTEKALEEDK